MAIRYEDITDGDREPNRAGASAPRPAKVAETAAADAEPQATTLPFAKPVKADKKRKKR